MSNLKYALGWRDCQEDKTNWLGIIVFSTAFLIGFLAVGQLLIYIQNNY